MELETVDMEIDPLATTIPGNKAARYTAPAVHSNTGRREGKNRYRRRKLGIEDPLVLSSLDKCCDDAGLE